MIVGIDASRAVTTRPTGTETYSRCLIREMLRLSPPYVFRLYTRFRPPEATFPGAETRVIPFPRMWTHLRLSWEMLRVPPDVLFVPAHVLPLIRPRLSLVTVHDLGFLRFPQAHPVCQRLYLLLSTRWNVRVASHVIADSVATKQDITRYYRVDPDKVSVVYPGVDETLSPVQNQASIDQVKRRYGINGRYLLYLGTLQPRKNLSRLVKAFAEILPDVDQDMKLVLAGKPGWLTGDLFEQIDRLELEQRVVLPGYIANQDKAAILSGAQAFVFPSLYEGFGLPVLEAQACGCPVITSTTSSLTEVAGSSALLVDPSSREALASAMRRLVVDPELRVQLAKAGYENVRRFSWVSAARQVLGIIDSLVEEG